jgi:hypothetical protein
MAMGLLGMLVAMLTMLVSRRRVLLGLLVLPVRMMVGRLLVVVCGDVMVCGGLPVMLDGRVFVRLCHGLVLLERFGEIRVQCARAWDCGPPTGGRTDRIGSTDLRAASEAAREFGLGSEVNPK